MTSYVFFLKYIPKTVVCIVNPCPEFLVDVPEFYLLHSNITKLLF